MKHTITIFTLVFLLTGVFSVCEAEKLYVFYPTTTNPQIVQKRLSEALPDFEILVFGRYTDFIEKIRTDQPDAVITKPALLEKLEGYQKTLSGAVHGKTEESYVLLSIDKPVDTAMLSGKTIGIIDMFGRVGIESFVSAVFKVPPKIKRVTKIEDLLPLLTFNMAEAVFIADSQVPYFRKMSNLIFVENRVSEARVGIISLGVKQTADSKALIAKFTALNKELSDLFEIDQWK